VAESFFKSLKAEWTNSQQYSSRQQAATAVFEYVEGGYNTRRRHSALNNMTPIEFETYSQTRLTA
jgi:putative transposase